MGIIKLGERTYYLSGRNNIGIWLSGEDRCWLIDSGGSAKEGAFILEQLRQRGWTVEGVALTHYHADHTGGAGYLQRATGCLVCGDTLTAGLCQDPLMVPAVLCGGHPPLGLRHGYYTAEPFTASPLSALPPALTVYDLPGHVQKMCGFGTPEGVVFVGDATISSQVLDADGLIYVYDPGAFLKTLDKMDQRFSAMTVVPAHSRPTKEIAAFNAPVRERMEALIEFVFQSCLAPKTREQATALALAHFGCKPTLGTYMTMSAAVFGVLSYLCDCGRMSLRFDQNVQTCESIESFYAGLF